MIIEIEFSLFINLTINFFILFLTALFLKEKAKFIWLSALVGGIIAVILPLFALPSYAKLLTQVFVSVLLVSVSFNFKSFKRFCQIYSVFLGLSFLFGGGCYAISSTFGQLPLLVVLAICLVIFLVSKSIFKMRLRQKHIEDFSFKVKIFNDGKLVEEEGFLDSGNLLYDPITKKPVVLINFDIFKKLYENTNYLSAYLKKTDLTTLNNAHYIKLSTIASGTQILVFSVGKVDICGNGVTKEYKNMMLGLTFSGFERSFGKNILLHGEII